MLALLAKYKVMVAIAALVGALGVGTAGVAAANGALPLSLNTLASATPAAKHGAHPGDRPGKRGLAQAITHGSIITQVNGAFVTYTIDVGQVTSASSSSITVKRVDGQQVTLAISSTTVWGANHAAPKNPAKLQGRHVVIFSQGGTAVQIGRGNGVLKNAVHAELTLWRNGKTRDITINRGVAQSASATSISVKRADGVVVTMPVAAKARWVQAPHTKTQPGAVPANTTVTILSVGGQVMGVRIGDASGASAQ